MQKIVFKKTKNLVMLGGGDFSLTLAKWCKKNSIEVRIITSSRHFTETIFSGKVYGEELEKNNIEYLKCDTLEINEVNSFIADIENPLFLSFGAAWIFTREHIDKIFNKKLLNFHSTRLPRDRGGGGYSWQILRGNRLGNLQIHLVDKGVDTGELLWGEEFLFPLSCRTPKDYLDYESQIRFDMFSKILLELKENDISVLPKTQNPIFLTYWPRLNSKKDSWINWDYSADSLQKFVSAFDDPYCGAQTLLNGTKRIFLKKAMQVYEDGSFHPYQAGIVYRNNGRWLSIATSEGTLIIEEVFDESGEMILDNIAVGSKLYTPFEKLELAAERVVYTPKGLKE